jgi:hypothetical protein
LVYRFAHFALVLASTFLIVSSLTFIGNNMHFF